MSASVGCVGGPGESASSAHAEDLRSPWHWGRQAGHALRDDVSPPVADYHDDRGTVRGTARDLEELWFGSPSR